jgi:nucleoside 2-deoxyribosyltransferase
MALALLQKDEVTPSQRACLTTWLHNQREAGAEWPYISAKFLRSSLASLRPLTTTERIDKVLLYFNKRIRVGGEITTTSGEFETYDNDAIQLAVLTESISKDDLLALLFLLVEMTYLKDRRKPQSSLYQFTPTARGWLRIEELVTRLPDTSQAFVAMWFNPATELAYKEGIEPAIAQLGYRAVRIDRKEHVNKIDDEIIAEIRRSKFLVADFTCEKEKVRGGVYFEAGFAMALQMPVIWTCSKDSLADVHFDTRQYNHIIWETPEKLREALMARIGAVIGGGPLIGR